MSGSFLLSHSSSLPPPASQDVSSVSLALLQPLPSSGRQQPCSPTWGFCGLWLSRVRPLMPSAPRRGLQGRSLREGAHCPLLPPLFKTHVSRERRLQAHSTAASCSAHDLGLLPFPLWASVSWGSRQPAQPRGSEAHSTACVHLVVVSCCSARELPFWLGIWGAAPCNSAVTWNVGFELLSPRPPAPTFSHPQLRSHHPLGTLMTPSVCLSWQKFTG